MIKFAGGEFTLLLLIIFLNIHYSISQNLVKNPSFEIGVDVCEPNFSGNDFPSLAVNWSCPSAGTSDLYSTQISDKTCYSHMPYAGADRSLSQLHIGSQLPRTGNRFAGIFCYDSPNGEVRDYKEYIQAELTEALIPGEFYCFKMYVSRAEFGRFATNNIGAYFGNFIPFNANINTELQVTPQIVFKQVIKESNDWVELSTHFRVKEAARYMIIGNFTKDKDLTIEQVTDANSLINSNSAYYFIDDVSVVRIMTPSKLTFLGEKVICSNSTTNLTVIGDYDNVIWSSFADTIKVISSGNTLAIRQATTTKYLARAIKCGLTLRDTITIQSLHIPQIDLGRDTILCKDSSLKLDAGMDGNRYQWQDNSTEQFFNVTKAGTYSVKVTNADNCSNIDYIKVSTRNPPKADLGVDTLVCGILPKLFANEGDTYLWSTGVTDSVFQPTTSGRYWVQISNRCGFSKDTIQIYTFNDLFIPNVLTLNQDSLNAKFIMRGIGDTYQSSLRVVDRWGNEIYTNSDYDGSWPTPEQEIPEGTYYYLVDFPGCRSYKGWLQIIK